MLTQASDFREECSALHLALGDVPDELWSRPTQFKRWTFDDIIGHLIHRVDTFRCRRIAMSPQVRCDDPVGRADPG